MRIRIFTIILIFFTCVLLGGLMHTQISMHRKYKIMSEDNRLKVVPLMAPRGRILDKNAKVLVRDELSFKVSVIYSRIKNMELLADTLSSVLGVSKKEIIAKIKETRWKPYVPVCVVEDIGKYKAIQLEEMNMNYPGLLLEAFSKRKYVYNNVASAVLGYLGSINKAEFKKLKHYGYRINDLVGKDGIERQYDDYLKGQYGGKQIEVDHRGREVLTMGYREPVSGNDVYLTIDLELQKFCDGLLSGRRGAIVAMSPDSGAILAMSSAPSYDPNIFIDRAKRKQVGSVLTDKEYPLLNRAIAGIYPPGSLFKVIGAVGALESEVLTEETVFNCPGKFSLGKFTFHCWKKKGHGEITLKDAIKQSCNVYFFNLGLLLGVDGISGTAKKFGLGSLTGIDIPGEKSGVCPTVAWKRKREGIAWYKGDTVNYSIGQGYLLCTPLQIARMMSVFANGGYLVKPYVVEKVNDVPVHNIEKVALGIDEEILNTVREGLRRVVNEKRGTGVKARLEQVIVAGKTGTAQTSKKKSHGWFMGFAPFVDGKMVVVVFDEYGGKGGYYAAGTAGKVFRKAQELGLLD